MLIIIIMFDFGYFSSYFWFLVCKNQPMGGLIFFPCQNIEVQLLRKNHWQFWYESLTNEHKKWRRQNLWIFNAIFDLSIQSFWPRLPMWITYGVNIKNCTFHFMQGPFTYFNKPVIHWLLYKGLNRNNIWKVMVFHNGSMVFSTLKNEKFHKLDEKNSVISFVVTSNPNIESNFEPEKKR